MKMRGTSSPQRVFCIPHLHPHVVSHRGSSASSTTRSTIPFGLTLLLVFAFLAVDLGLDELLDQVAADVVGALLRGRLHELGAVRDDRAPDAAVLGDLAGAQRVDDDAGRVRRVPDLEL